MKLDENCSLLELLNKQYEIYKFVNDDELLKIGKDALTKKRASDDNVVLVQENIKLIKKLNDAMEEIRKLKEYVDVLMNMDV